jgi:hypothetical protein
VTGRFSCLPTNSVGNYVVQQEPPSHRYQEEVRVRVVLPSSGVTYYVPAEYGVRDYCYTVVNDRTVLVDQSAGWSVVKRLRSLSGAGTSTRCGSPCGQAAINHFVDEHKSIPKALLMGRPDPNAIIAAVKRGHQALDSIH